MDISNTKKEEARLLREERVGFLFFNRHGEEGWEDHNAFYASEDGLVSVVLENEEENEEVAY